jgi:hypothetical protein
MIERICIPIPEEIMAFKNPTRFYDELDYYLEELDEDYVLVNVDVHEKIAVVYKKPRRNKCEGLDVE